MVRSIRNLAKEGKVSMHFKAAPRWAGVPGRKCHFFHSPASFRREPFRVDRRPLWAALETPVCPYEMRGWGTEIFIFAFKPVPRRSSRESHTFYIFLVVQSPLPLSLGWTQSFCFFGALLLGSKARRLDV